MRVFVIVLLILLFLTGNSQCLWDVINQEFPNQTAVLGQDSVELIVSEQTNIAFGGSASNSNLFIDGILQPGGTGTAFSGLSVKIKPIAIGTEEIFVNSPCSPFSATDFTVVSNPLLVNWLSANTKNNQSHISWSVASQINNSHFIIEHSIDGRSFSLIGEITGDGTSNETKHYTFIHKTICDGIYTVGCISYGVNYNLIKQVDYHGKYSYSDIASVRYVGSVEATIYSNPATTEVTISTTEPTSVQVMDVFGRLLLNRDISDRQNTINLSQLPTGILIFVVGDLRSKVLKE